MLNQFIISYSMFLANKAMVVQDQSLDRSFYGYSINDHQKIAKSWINAETYHLR